MKYFDLVIVNGAFNDRYDNNAKRIDFSIKNTVINTSIEESSQINHATFLISGKSLISSSTLLNRYSDIIIFKKERGFKFIQVTFYNCPGRGVQTPE